jgi:hypothetical protein
MRSATLPSFNSLDKHIQTSARKAYQLWRENPFHPSLHFKCINREENVWSVRVTRGYRAVGTLEGDSVTWFWIGGHSSYERFFT